MNKHKQEIPEKFQNTHKSFVKKLFKQNNQLHTRSFMPFPKNISFYGKDKGEEIVLIVRQHWIAYLPNIAIALLILLLPLVLLSISFSSPLVGTPTLYIGMLIVAGTASFNILITTIARWFYTITIVTDERIVAVKMQNAFSHSYVEAQLEKIEDVTHRTVGFLGTFLDVGDVDIDTAGHEIDFRLTLLPRPRDIQDVLNDLLEMKQKGDI